MNHASSISPHTLLKIVFFLALGFLLSRTLAFYHPDGLIDDAYISFRYAENFAAGNGLVFNPGERVEGYTNFLWTLLLAGTTRLGFDIIPASMVLAGACAIVTLGVLYWVGRRMVQEGAGVVVAALPMVLWVAHGSVARYILSGMETLLFTLVLAVAWVSTIYARRPFLTGLLFGIAALTRPEGVLYGGVAWLWLLVVTPSNERRRTALHFLAGAALVYAPYFSWRFSYYGYLFPNTYYAKASGFQWERLMRGIEVLGYTINQSALAVPGVVALLALLTQNKRMVQLGGVVVGVTLLYFVYVGGDFVIWFGPRFLMPIFPLFFVGVAWGVQRVATWFPTPILRNGAALAASLVLAGHMFWFAWWGQWTNLAGFAEQMQGWRELGTWLQVEYSPETTIATDAAGLIPYYSGFVTLDMYGLTDAHIAHLEMAEMGSGTVAHEKYDPVYILAQNPTCIISTYVTETGIPAAAGLGAVQNEVLARYHLVAVAKKGGGAPEDGRWVIPTSTYSADLFKAGYITGAFCQKSPSAVNREIE
jgi:arabinofuranosyltransferase